MNICDSGLDTGERIRRYAPEPCMDVPDTRCDEAAMRYYTRELEIYADHLERPIESESEDWIDRHPRIALAIACAFMLGALWFASRRK